MSTNNTPLLRLGLFIMKRKFENEENMSLYGLSHLQIYTVQGLAYKIDILGQILQVLLFGLCYLGPHRYLSRESHIIFKRE